ITDYTVSTDGRLDIQRDARLLGATGVRIRHEPRFSPNDLGGRTPTEYQDYFGTVAGEKEFNRLSVRLDGGVDRLTYDNTQTAGGAVLAESLRNRREETVSLRVGYELAPLRTVYGLGGYNWRNYDSPVDITGLNRNSKGYTLALGANYDIN